MKFWKIVAKKFCAGFLAGVMVVYPVLPYILPNYAKAQEVSPQEQTIASPAPSESNQSTAATTTSDTTTNTNNADLTNNVNTNANTGNNEINPSPTPTDLPVASPSILPEVSPEALISPIPEVSPLDNSMETPLPSIDPSLEPIIEQVIDATQAADLVSPLPDLVSPSPDLTTQGNSDNPNNSGNTTSETTSSSTTVSNTNDANVDNKLDSTANTGNNTFNLGKVSETGTASASINAANVVNTNLVGNDFLYSLINLLTQSDGDLDLSTVGNNSLISPEILAVIANNQKTGQGSVNLAIAALLSQIAIYNQNQATLTNNVNADANSGNNTVDHNKSTLNTGDATANVNLFNMVNTNLTGSDWFFAIVNLFNNMNGNIILPNEFEFLNWLGSSNSASVSAINSQTGNNSTNQATAINANSVNVNNNNNATVTNNIDTNANSGNNTLTGSGAINTGDAVASASLGNMVNTNITGSNWVMIVIQNFGEWTGKLVGWWGNFLQIGNTAFAWVQLPYSDNIGGGNVTAINADTGDNSTNQSLAVTSSNLTIDNQNQATVTNNITANADTGNNTSDGKKNQINTGDASADTNIFNLVNTNISGNHWYFVVINIFGKFVGDIFMPRPDLQLAISSNRSRAWSGDIVTYTINFSNIGKWAAYGIKITDNLPSGMTFVSASNEGQLNGNTIIWQLNNLDKNNLGSVSFDAQVGGLSNGSKISDLAMIEAASPETSMDNNSASTDVIIQQPENNNSNSNPDSDPNSDHNNNNTDPSNNSGCSIPNAPLLISAIAGQNSVVLNWDQTSGQVDYYQVIYGTQPGVYQYGSNKFGNSSSRSFTVSELAGNNMYYFAVRAGNSCGEGLISNIVTSTPGGNYIVGAALGFTSQVLAAEVAASPIPTPAPQSDVLGETTTEKPVCWWWLITSALALIITSATLAIWGSQKPKLWWLLPIVLTLAAFVGDQYIAHQFTTASKWCDFMWLWSTVSTALPTIVFTKLSA